MKAKKPRKKYKYVGRRFSIRYILIFLTLVLTVFFFLNSPYYNISFVAVSGNSTLTKPGVRALSGITRGTNIFRINTNTVEEKLLLNPYVASAEVKRDLPNTVVVSIVEYEPVAVLPYNGGFMEVSEEGGSLVSSTEMANLNLDLPLVSGLGIKEGVPPGSEVENERLPIALKILELGNQKGIIAEVDVHDLSNMYFFTFSKIRVLLGNQEQLEEKLGLALDIASKVPNAQYIDVRFPKSPVYK